MERGRRHRRSKSASGIEGIGHIQRPKAVLRLSSDSCSPIDGCTRGDTFVLDLGKSPLGRATGTPMKKLLAEEMSKEVDSKRRPPSVIARLMGLEGSASPKHVSRQPKKPSVSYEQKHISVNIPWNNKYDSFSSSRSSEDLHSFKDVYEDLEASHLADRRCSKRWSASSSLTKDEMAFIQQKFVEAKLRSAGLFQGSNAKSEVSFPHSSSSRGSPIAVLKPHSCKYKGNPEEHNVHPETSSIQELSSHLKRKDGLLLERHVQNGDRISHKSSKIEKKGEKKIFPRKIVVLKPNKMQNTRISGLSPDQLHYLQNLNEMNNSSSDGLAEMASFRKKGASRSVMSEDAREIASRIAKRIAEECDETIDKKSTGLRGYAGDESSYDANESASDCDSEVSKFTSQKSFGDGKLHRYPSSLVSESSVNREAKHRLSERWKMTQRYQDLEMVSRGSTLGEMLAIPESETIPKPVAARTNHDNVWRTEYGHCGISSKDGWKYELSKTSSRSTSVPQSVSGQSHKRSTHHDKSVEEKYLVSSDHIRSDRCKVVKGNMFHGGIYSSEDSDPMSNKPLPYQDSFTNENIMPEANFDIEAEATVKTAPIELALFQTAEKDVMCRSPVFDVKMSAEHGSKPLSTQSPMFLREGSNLGANDSEPTSQDSSNSSLQSVGGQSNPSKNSNEENHASPVSILDVPSAEDASSSSESFERVGAELHELWMQLRLLKMETGTYTEVPSLAPTEDEIAFGGNLVLGAEGWETSYAFDILQESGLADCMLDMYKTKWYSPNCPLDVKLFDELENKYSEETTCLSSERRLIFDRTNQAIMEVFEENIDLCPWVKPKLAGFSSSLPASVGLVLKKLISHEDPYGELSEEALDVDMQWLNSKQEIDAIGNDIEKMLIDDMIIDVLLCN